MADKVETSIPRDVAEWYDKAFFSKESEISNAYYNGKMRAIRSTVRTYFKFDLLSDWDTSIYHEPPVSVRDWVLNNRLATLKYLVAK
ncbi:MAG: hypothetical protein JJU01_08610 [Alkalibacterium sp.]|nr:hypothetical protein [Alkalibacterium sp.]